MDKVLYILPALACPLGMGAMMFMMMRGTGRKPTPPTSQTPGTLTVHVDPRETELAQLREEIQHLSPNAEREPAAFRAPSDETTRHGTTQCRRRGQAADPPQCCDRRTPPRSADRWGDRGQRAVDGVGGGQYRAGGHGAGDDEHGGDQHGSQRGAGGAEGLGGS